MAFTTKATVLVVVAVFCFHLSRFYLSLATCAHHTRNGYALQHCQDIPSGLNAKRVQLRDFSAPISEPVLQTIWVSVPPPADATHDIPLPPPFHPPRFLS